MNEYGVMQQDELDYDIKSDFSPCGPHLHTSEALMATTYSA